MGNARKGRRMYVKERIAVDHVFDFWKRSSFNLVIMLSLGRGKCDEFSHVTY